MQGWPALKDRSGHRVVEGPLRWVTVSVGTIIDYNRRLHGCLFHNDLSIMKLVIDNNWKKRHLAAKHETKKRQVVSFLAMKSSKTREKVVKVFQNVKRLLVIRIIYWYSGTNPNNACWGCKLEQIVRAYLVHFYSF